MKLSTSNSSLFTGAAFVGLATLTLSATLSAPAQAFTFSSGVFTSTGDPISFTFLGSNGRYWSELGVYDATTRDLISTVFAEDAPGYIEPQVGDWQGSVSGGPVILNFATGTQFVLGLKNLALNGGAPPVLDPVFSDTAPPYGALASGAAPNMTFWFNDGYPGDADYNDFGVRVEAVPEPFTMAGLAIAGGGLLYARRRKQRQA